MSNYLYQHNQLSSTFCALPMYSLVTIQLPGAEKTRHPSPKINKLYTNSLNCDISILNDNISYPIDKENYRLTENWFEQAVSNFYSRFVENQELMSIEFKKIIHENLWDLYES